MVGAVAHHQRQVGEAGRIGFGYGVTGVVDDQGSAAVFPNRERRALGHRDDDGVGQKPHDARALDPADLFDPPAQSIQVDVQDRLVATHAAGAGDVGLGVGAGPLDVQIADPKALSGELLIDAGRHRLGETAHARVASDDGQAAQHDDKSRDRERAQRREADPAGGREFGGGVGRALAALGGAGLGRGLGSRL